MIRCVKCGQVYAIQKAGKVRGMQRYHCKDCELYFTLESNKEKEVAPNPKNTITINDIAEALNISYSTVSKALNNKADISAETKKNVLEAARRMNYRPNLNAQSLVNKKSNIIGIVLPSIGANFFYTSIINGIQEIAHELGYSALICLSNESYEQEVENCKLLLASRVAGVIISVTSKTKDFEHIHEFQRNKIPIVFANRAVESIEASSVAVNSYNGAVTIMEHLIAQGCKKIAHIGGPQNLLLSKERLKGYVDTLMKYKLPVKEKWIVYNDMYRDNSKECADKLLMLEDRPDAIFTYTDFIGIEVIQAAKVRHIQIPAELCVAGFSNDPVSEIIDPGLTTLSQPALEMGKIAAEILIHHIEEQSSELIKRTLNVDLIARRSSIKLSGEVK